MTQIDKPKYLDILQVYRGFAALMVVIHHAVGSLDYYHKTGNSFFNILGLVGKLGVDFFFVLSGFIIAYSAHFKYSKPNALREYVVGRVLRIYVPYLPVGIAMLFLYKMLPDLSNSNRDISIFSSITLIPRGNPALSVAWTLLFELMFYFLFAMSFYSRKLWNYFVVFWTILILLSNYSSLSFFTDIIKNPFGKVFLAIYNIEFILGYLLAQIVLKGIVWNYRRTLLLMVVFGVLFLSEFGMETKVFRFSGNIFFALFTFFTFYYSVTYLNFDLKKNNPFMLIGNATYSIYLLHNPIQMVLIRLFPHVTNGVEYALALAIPISVCCLIGYGYYLIFEKRAIGILKTFIGNYIKTS